MNLLLICETAIIEQIFSLVCKKLNLELTITDDTNVKEKYDLIVIDQSFIDDKFNIIKQYSKRLGAISSEELPFDKSRDFIIPRPFLPTKLQEIIKEEIENIKEDEREATKEFLNSSKPTNSSSNLEDDYFEDDEVTIPITDYVESLADDVYSDIEDDNDESIVSLASLKEGGVLDDTELSKINNILKEEEIQNEVHMDQQDWKDISDIIDDALEEVKEYEFNLDEGQGKSDVLPYKLVLSDYSINELKPFLEKFNQEVIDKLSSGKSVDIRLVLKDK
ncbi:hypothetical protein [Arcobacter roscoffensis]|uniref:Highly acidic protein n=1 Tax=Arcobacter roscoffensis TaxID=2961520 RepID=A0ABY5E5Z1_9BACT|nr:hypothetical protein [Arcobacter roscoffensis]UTJ07170.1 hypothetical protein NJU99_03515 [Arcobacter roscoffensis]